MDVVFHADASMETAVSGGIAAASAVRTRCKVHFPQMRPPARTGPSLKTAPLQRLAADEFAEDGGRGDAGDLLGGEGYDVVQELEEADGVGVGR